MIWVWSPVCHFIMWHVKIKDLKLHMQWWLILGKTKIEYDHIVQIDGHKQRNTNVISNTSMAKWVLSALEHVTCVITLFENSSSGVAEWYFLFLDVCICCIQDFSHPIRVDTPISTKPTTDHSIEWSLPTGGMRLGAPLQQNIIINNSKIFGNVFWCLKFLVVFFWGGVAPESINEFGVKLCDAKFMALPPFSQGCFFWVWGWREFGCWTEYVCGCEGDTAESRRVKCRFWPRELKEKGSFQGWKTVLHMLENVNWVKQVSHFPISIWWTDVALFLIGFFLQFT